MDSEDPGKEMGQPEVSGSKTGVKRRASRAGSRSVSSLSAEQLERKRANDREAQRSIRQRTKDHITHLEDRIRELTANQPADIEKVRRRNEELENELKELKKQLRLLESRTDSDYSSSRSTSPGASQALQASVLHQQNRGNIQIGNGHSASSTRPLVDSSLVDRRYSVVNSVLPNASYSSDHAKMVMLNSSRTCHSGEMTPIFEDIPERRSEQVDSVHRGFGWQRLSTPSPVSQPADIPNRHAWESAFQLLPPNCPVDHLLMGIIQRQKSLLIQNPIMVEAIIGPYHPSLKILVYPGQTEGCHPLSTVIANLLKRTSMKSIVERAACLFTLYHLAQWQIAPSPETYNRLAIWLRPRASQLLTPHPLWISQIPFGQLRDKVIAEQETYATSEFQGLYNASLSLNWLERQSNILVFENEDDVRVSDEFARHIHDLGNWSLGEPFSRRYPELAGSYNFAPMDGLGRGV